MKPPGEACDDGCPLSLELDEAPFPVPKLGAEPRRMVGLGGHALIKMTCATADPADLGHG
jgi:hypothetical protein